MDNSEKRLGKLLSARSILQDEKLLDPVINQSIERKLNELIQSCSNQLGEAMMAHLKVISSQESANRQEIPLDIRNSITPTDIKLLESVLKSSADNAVSSNVLLWQLYGESKTDASEPAGEAKIRMAVHRLNKRISAWGEVKFIKELCGYQFFEKTSVTNTAENALMG